MEARLADGVHEQLVAHEVGVYVQRSGMLESQVCGNLVEVVSQIFDSSLKFEQFALLSKPSTLELHIVVGGLDLLELLAFDGPDRFG